MSTSAPKCTHVSDVYDLFDYPSEDKLRTPGLFLDEIRRFAGYCKDAGDEIKFIKECIPQCEAEAAAGAKRALKLKKEITALNSRVAKELRKKTPRMGQVRDWQARIESCQNSVDEVNEDAAEWAQSKAGCVKLLGDWATERMRRLKIVKKMKEDFNKGPHTCGLKTPNTASCGYPSEYVYAHWSYCNRHRDQYGERP